GVFSLPVAGKVVITDVLDAGHTEKLYELLPDPRTVGLHLELHPSAPSKPFYGSITLINARGQAVGGPIPMAGGPAVWVDIAEFRFNRTEPLFVRITALTALSGTSPAPPT